MKHRPKMLALAGVIGAVAQVQPVAARDLQPDALPSVITKVIDCRSILDLQQRVTCYDAAADALAAATASKEILVADRTAMQEARRTLFGFSLPKLKLFESGEELDEIKSTTASVTQVSTTASGLYVLTLEDGGRWAQKENVFVNRPQAGQVVTISRGPVGGFLAKIGNGRAFRVQRLSE